MLDGNALLEVIGEGPTDVGPSHEVVRPERGVVNILIHKLCEKPENMLVNARYVAHLQQGKKFSRKVEFAKRQAYYNGKTRGTDGLVIVVDSEGDEKALNRRTNELHEGRDACFPQFPMAVGVAQPCIESWLLADATAVRLGLQLPETPRVPEKPEELPAPCDDEAHSPKAKLAGAAGSRKGDLSAKQKNQIATAMNDMELVRNRCPLSFAPFADEVQRHIQPLF